jgi:hypothetical protein
MTRLLTLCQLVICVSHVGWKSHVLEDLVELKSFDKKTFMENSNKQKYERSSIATDLEFKNSNIVPVAT